MYKKLIAFKNKLHFIENLGFSPFDSEKFFTQKKISQNFSYYAKNNEWIHCGRTESLDLKSIFHQISAALQEGKRHFREFSLNNTAINELQESTFGDITFDWIKIDGAHNLSQIHTKAFTGLNSTISNLFINDTSLKNNPPDHDTFAAITSMQNLEVVLLAGSLIEEIPDNAFRPTNGTQDKLTNIGLSRNKITKIGNNAFNQLNSLNILQLGENPINHITENAFNFLNSSEIVLAMYMFECLFNNTSFEKGAFSHLNRPTYLYFDRVTAATNVTYLDQRIFEEFFNNNDKNGIELFSVDCNDCRSFWLFSNQKYSNRSGNRLICSDGKQFTDKSNFSECVKFA